MKLAGLARQILVVPAFRQASRLLTQKLVRKFFFEFYYFIPRGCASDFFEMLPKFKMAARGQLQKFLWAQKL